MALEQVVVDRLIQQLVNEYLTARPGSREVRVRELGDELGVSHDTIRRWSLGRNRPYSHTGTALIRYLRLKYGGIPTEEEWSDTLTAFLEKGDPDTRKDRIRVITREFGMSVPTVERWATGESYPHPEMMRACYPALCRILDTGK